MLPRLQQHILNLPTLFLIAGCVALACLLVTVFYVPQSNPPAVVPAQQAQTPTATAPATPMPSDKATIVLELFNPTDQSLTNQLSETALKEQIEQITATSYILSNCNLMSHEEYRDNFRALIVYAQRMHYATDATDAEIKVRQIAQSASASYSLLYRRTKCTNEKLPAIADQMRDWQRAYLDE